MPLLYPCQHHCAMFVHGKAPRKEPLPTRAWTGKQIAGRTDLIRGANTKNEDSVDDQSYTLVLSRSSGGDIESKDAEINDTKIDKPPRTNEHVRVLIQPPGSFCRILFMIDTKANSRLFEHVAHPVCAIAKNTRSTRSTYEKSTLVSPSAYSLGIEICARQMLLANHK